MIIFDNSKCNQCSLCIKTCHEYCISLSNGGIKIDYELCSTCTQCIAICPNQALSWNNILPEKINKDLLPGNLQLKEFFKSRRSERHFSNKKISRDILREIALIGKYSPTNNYDIDVIIIDNDDIIQKLESECNKKIKRMYKLFFKPKLMQWIGKKVSPEYKKAEIKILQKKYTFHQAPALIILIANPRVKFTELSAQYFLYNMHLYAKTLGIGSRVSGAGKILLARSKKVKKILEIPKHKNIQGILFLGYPSLKYVNKVEGISPKIYYK